ncbi:MAG: helix-turn-helix domain-containing protein [Planctomycetes bacterium]|nr:helix-turn-helix domain-containing protein [Planctomycetota bacterium]NUQ36079.1 helix-turn-helix transcriptional regulator [Planctomycetaceae bacterium]
MSANQTPKLDDDQAIRKRLMELIVHTSQAELARKTETSHTNISRYLKGTKPPASFLSKLARNMNVNPAWLLLGEGAPFLSSVTSDVASMAGNVLELVNAMNSVSKLKLGELLGKDHLKVLRQLNEALTAHENLRQELNRQTANVMKDVLQKFDGVLKEGVARQTAARYLEAAKQLSRLCSDDELLMQLAQRELAFESYWGTEIRTYELQRRLFIHRLARTEDTDEQFAESAFRHATALHSAHRCKEAIRVAYSALGMMRGKPGLDYWRNQLLVDIGMVEVEMGSLHRGFERLLKVHTTLYPNNLVISQVAVTVAQMYAGILDIEGLAHSPSALNRNLSFYGLRFARLYDDAGLMRSAYRWFVGNEKHLAEPDSTASIVSRLALDAIEGNLSKALKEFDDLNKHEERQLVRQQHPVFHAIYTDYTAMLYRLGGEKSKALEATEQAFGEYRAIPKIYDVRVLAYGMNAINILKLVQPDTRNSTHKAMRSWAEQCIRRYLSKGYGCFKHLMPLLGDEKSAAPHRRQ